MSYTKTTLLPVTPDEAFALITQPERLRRWQTVSATVDLRAGGAYRWIVTPGHIAEGTFREVEPGRRIVFGWGWPGSDELPADASTVTVTVEPEGDGTRVTLVHDGLNEQQTALHAEGWDHFFERLERVAATGDAGQDEWAWAPENLDPVVAADAALAAVQPVLRALTAQDRPKPTPCDDFTCHELAEHFMASLAQLGGLAGVEVERPAEGSLEHKVSTMAAQAIDGWRALGLASTVPGSGGDPLPVHFGASILALEIALHGWDLAQGSGQQLRMSDELVAYLFTLADVVVPAARTNGSFKDAAAPDSGASPIDDLAAFAGRTPIAA